MTDHSTPDAPGGIGTFERWLSLWVALAITAGVLLGNIVPGLFQALADLQVASVNLPVAVLIWAMVYPMMVGVDFTALSHVGERPKGLVITLLVNWLIKPFTMAALGVLFFEVVFAGLIPPDDAQAYLAGVILLGAAPCTAMVFVWSNLTRGDATYTLVQVSVNDVIMVFAFAPIVAFLLGVTDIVVPWNTLILSVLLYIVIPLIAGLLTRTRLMAMGGEARGRLLPRPDQTLHDPRPPRHRGPALRLSGAGHHRHPAGHRPDRRAAPAPELWYLLRRLRHGAGVESAVQRGGALRSHRHVELL